jgi:hypothetical protein
VVLATIRECQCPMGTRGLIKGEAAASEGRRRLISDL